MDARPRPSSRRAHARARAPSTSIRRTIRPAGRSTRQAQRAILDHCRRHGIWIIADDAYERLYLRRRQARERWLPHSSICREPDDRVVSTNTFSKSWLMTGWRLGWIVAPAELIPDLAKLARIQHVVRPAVRPARGRRCGDRRASRVIAHTVGRLRSARDSCMRTLQRMPGDRGGGTAGRDVRVLSRREASPTASISASASSPKRAWASPPA